MNSDPFKTTILDLLNDLDPQRLHAEIDQPAKRVIAEYDWPQTPQPTHWGFMKLTQNLVIRLYGNSPRLPRHVTSSDGYSKAIVWLDQCYPNSGASGAETALNEFIQARDGATHKIKQAILTGFIASERQQIVQNAFAEKLGDDWDCRRRLTEAFFELFQAGLPPVIASAKPSRFTNSIENLLLTHSETQAGIRELIFHA